MNRRLFSITFLFCYIFLSKNASCELPVPLPEYLEVYNSKMVAVNDAGIFENTLNLLEVDNCFDQTPIEPFTYHVEGEGASAVYELEGRNGKLLTKRAGSWTLSARFKCLSLHDSGLVVAGLSIQDPHSMAKYGHYFSHNDLGFGIGTFWDETESIRHWGADISYSNEELFIRITRDRYTHLIFSEYSEDGTIWNWCNSIYLSLPEKADYAVEIYAPANNSSPAHFRLEDVKIEPASPYGIRTLSHGRYVLGNSIDVILKLTNPNDHLDEIVIWETPPQNFSTDWISDNGRLIDGTIHWDLILEPGDAFLSYRIHPNSNTDQISTFTGQIGTRALMGMSEILKSGKNLIAMRENAILYSLFFFVPLVMFVLHLGLFFFYPVLKENFYYAVFLAATAAAVFLIGYGEIYFSEGKEVYILNNRRIFLTLVVCMQASILPFLYTMTYPKLPIRYVFFTSCWLLFLFWTWFIPLGDLYSDRTPIHLYFFMGLSTLFCLESLRVLIGAVRKKKEGIGFVVCGASLFMAALLVSIYTFAGNMFYWPVVFYLYLITYWPIPSALLVFLISMSIYISYCFAQSHKGLQALNVDLENRVEQRTAELNTMNAELQEANAQLIQLDQMKSQFVSQASHDLRTPLTAIKGSLDNLLMGIAGDLNEKQSKIMERATKSVDRLTNLINDVLDLNRIETGRIVLEKTDIPFKTLVENIIHENKPAAEQKGIQLSFEVKEGDYTLHIDGGKMERVVGELVSNAIKYTPYNGKVNVRLSHDDQLVSLSVQDSGIGMTPEECEKIWERFYRTGASKKFAKGSGLGLSIAKELVELHGGALSVESEVEKGATFTLSLPRKGD